jgi:hypothetical protein
MGDGTKENYREATEDQQQEKQAVVDTRVASEGPNARVVVTASLFGSDKRATDRHQTFGAAFWGRRALFSVVVVTWTSMTPVVTS